MSREKDSQIVTEILPTRRKLPLEGLYLKQDLVSLTAQLHKALVLSTYITDIHGVIAKADDQGHFHVPAETRNDSDWRLSQELMAQADVLISAGDYMRRVSAPGSHPQDILFQFEPGGEFEDMGEWRLRAGYSTRSPHLAVVSRRLDFELPKRLLTGGRRTMVFTTHRMAETDQARALRRSGAAVLGTGDNGVDGRRMVEHLVEEAGARVLVMTSGPSILELLLAAGRLDLLYITEVQREIPHADPSTVKRLLPDGKRIEEHREFSLTHQYNQEHVVTADGSAVSQHFLRYDKL